MKLVLPSTEFKESYIKAVKEYKKTDANERKDICELNIDDLEKDFSLYISNLLSESEGKNLPDGYVPQTTYWLIDNAEFIGRVSIRHTLTEHLLNEGGHIGYDIRPSKRMMGYGKKLLKLSLPKTKMLGIKKVLVTCNETNIASKKIIESNGGVFENALDIGVDKPKKLRFWITL